MGVNSLPKTVTRQRRNCDLNPGPSAPESSTLTTRLPSHPIVATARSLKVRSQHIKVVAITQLVKYQYKYHRHQVPVPVLEIDITFLFKTVKVEVSNALLLKSK